STHESPQQQRQYLRMFEQFRFDGIILTPFDDNLQQAHEIAARGTPVVLVDRTDDERLLPSVGTDHETGGYLAARHLIEQGCRRLCFVSGSQQVQQIVRRQRGYQKAVDEADDVSLEVLEFPDLDVELGREAGREIADRAPADRPDGVFGGNDLQAIGIVAELVDAGVDVPGEVAVIGYDDIVFAATTARPLTSIRQPSREIGAAAAQMLFDRLLSPDKPAQQQLFQPELQVRVSTRR
ncbi:MAG TPA: substrate-binding domain-containing protein, partial [Ruania sp.]|nr:substrate-binding domain-containing protein [Ruania sp.]